MNALYFIDEKLQLCDTAPVSDDANNDEFTDHRVNY